MLIAAAIVIVVIGLTHSLLGEKAIIGPLLIKTELSPFTQRTIRVAWHITTFFWFAIAAQLLAMHLYPGQERRNFLLIMIIAFGVSTIVSLTSSKGRHISWTGFGAATAILMWVFSS